MVLEAERLGCADEVIVIAAALSIQDPRERPAEQQAQADQQHARFADETSDFLAYLNLWRYLREQQRELSGSQFRKRCQAEYLHYLRIREWQDLVGAAARSAAKERRRSRSTSTPAEPGRRPPRAARRACSRTSASRTRSGREYLGARGARFAIFPGSALARKPPAWVMVAELVETSRLWGRDAARIDPKWVEPLAEHLVKRTYSEPRWERARASVVATERVTLYGLPIVTGRTVAYGRDRPGARRASCSSAARWSRATGRRATRSSPPTGAARGGRGARGPRAPARHPRRRRGAVRLLRRADPGRRRLRRALRPLVARRAPRATPTCSTFTRELLVDRRGRGALDRAGRPDDVEAGRPRAARSATASSPGAEHDGVTVHVPLKVLPQLRADRLRLARARRSARSS